MIAAFVGQSLPKKAVKFNFLFAIKWRCILKLSVHRQRSLTNSVFVFACWLTAVSVYIRGEVAWFLHSAKEFCAVVIDCYKFISSARWRVWTSSQLFRSLILRIQESHVSCHLVFLSVLRPWHQSSVNGSLPTSQSAKSWVWRMWKHTKRQYVLVSETYNLDVT